jgi:hypothetical protein
MSKLTGIFDQIEITVDDLIAPEDRLFCESLLNEYSLLVGQLNSYLEGLIALDNSLPQLNPAELEEYGSSSYVHKNYFKATSWVGPLSFTSVYSRKYIQWALKEASTQFKKKLIAFFNTKYNLGIDPTDDEFLNLENIQPAEWEKIVAKIISVSGGSLSDAGTKTLKEDFKHFFVRGEKVLPEIKGSTITFNAVYLTGSGSTYYDLQEKRPSTLIRALGYFEVGTINIPECLKKSFPLTKSDPIQFSAFRSANPDCKKFAGFRVFKNQRLDLKFVSAIDAEEFYKTFIEG